MMDEDRLLVRIAEMYYKEDKNQSEISKELKIHRSTISRLLKRSRQEGIVQITINYDLVGSYANEKQLAEKFGMDKVIIVPIASNLDKDQRNHLLAKALNEYLDDMVKDNMIIGFSWGQTMAAVADSLKEKETEGIVCVPMIGGPSGRLISDYHVNTITYEAAKRLKAKALLIDSPAIPETSDLKDALMKNEFNQELLEKWKHLDMAILGIGSPCLSTNETWSQFYGGDVLKSIDEKQVVGDVVSRFYTEDGSHVVNELDDRIIGISIDDLKRVAIRIGVAESIEKAEAIIGAMRGGYINVLVTTEETAGEIMKEV